MKVLILGAGGFIGGHVYTALSARGYSVVPADIVDTGLPGSLIFEVDHPDFASLFASVGADICVNCTGAASVPVSFAQPLRDYTLNTLRVAEMLEAIRIASPDMRFIHLSSAAVYGNPVESPITEMAERKPLSPYGWHKHFAEQLCEEYTHLFGLKTLSLRIFSAYGPGLRKQLFWDIYNKAKASERIEFFGTGEEARDFIYVEDIAACIECLIQNVEFDGRAINIASGIATTVREAVTGLISALDWKREIVFSGSERVGDPTFWRADVSFLDRLGFKPSYSIQSGLTAVARWLKDL
ncbi:NAD(P)-dependent oxidoreductase [Pseudomonas sp.]|uniref:NAD-dependent epimerase/dehydratase family protein n=1 Tax=Pseudomonas sp. TaxID=306 RepID=UPI00261C442F|nr:NAD-dependent epimerase/dehydratase family protein [Pseudomonas sp.]